MKSDTIDYLFWQISLHDDERAFQLLFSDFFSPLCSFANRYIDSKNVCEDLVQEVFFQLWQNRKKIQITTSTRNYLITNVRNACVDYLRHQEREDTYRERQALQLESEEQDAYSLYALSELEEMLNVALAKLPENVCQTFKMNRFEDKTYVQIAEERQISVKTVEAHISKALKLLRIDLKDYLPLIVGYLSL